MAGRLVRTSAPSGYTFNARYPARELEPEVIETVTVIGRGRVGSAIAGRLAERGVELVDGDADVVLLCVPDSAIRDVAAGSGPWTRLDRTRQRGHAALGPGSAQPALLAPPAADVHPRARPGAAGRRLRGRHRRDSRGARRRPRSSPRSSGWSRSSSRTTAGRSTTQAPRSPRTTSSRSTGSPPACSRRQARRPRRSSR